jgi:hypothetical protein
MFRYPHGVRSWSWSSIEAGPLQYQFYQGSRQPSKAQEYSHCLARGLWMRAAQHRWREPVEALEDLDGYVVWFNCVSVVGSREQLRIRIYTGSRNRCCKRVVEDREAGGVSYPQLT